MTAARDLSAVVIGAGFGGIAAAVELRDRGLRRVTVLERADRVGGVWRDNSYPGAACDVPSSLYSFSFAPNPSWRRRYAEQADILSYIERVARDEGLEEWIRLGCEVTTAAYDESARCWRVTGRDASGEELTFEADVLVSAVGQLSRPSVPAIPGADSFRGPAFHSAEWDHRVALAGRRVAVVGTGASAIQFVPHLQRLAGAVTVFQRSAPYVVPKPDRAYHRRHRGAFERVPATQRFGRELTRHLSERLNGALAEDTRFTKAFVAAFRLHLWHQVRDPRLRQRLTPDYPVGCKRLLFSNDWYPALTRPNVEVVIERITEIVPQGIRTADGRIHEADVIIYGTGFKATEFLAPIRVTGRGGQDLHDVWSDGARAYLGMTVPHFPNLFLVYGPNTNLGGSSILSMIECQTGYLGQAVQHLSDGVMSTVEVRRDVHERYDAEIQRRLQDSVWTSGCTSWYQTPSGRVTTNWPGLVEEYRVRTSRFQPADYAAEQGPTGTAALRRGAALTP